MKWTIFVNTKKGKKDALCVTVVKMILLVAKEIGRSLVI